jgi:hypothetical protein
MRSIYEVIEKIKEEVPEDWEDKRQKNMREYFFNRLDNVLESAKYRAPEAYYVNFEQTAGVLIECLGEPDTD